MRLFKVLSILSLLFSSNLFAVGPLENENVHTPRVLRGVKVAGQTHVDIVSTDSLSPLLRRIDGQFGGLSPSMDWSTYFFLAPRGVFWTKEETEAYKTLKKTGTTVDIDPERGDFSLLEENLKRITVNAGNYKIPLWEALLRHQIDGNGILVITQ